MKLRAMVIDDSRAMRQMVMQALEQTGLAEFEFIEAVDGADALAKFKPGHSDIVFVDWNMPKMTGIDFARAIRSLENTFDIPLVMITSEKALGKVDEAFNTAGVNLYICKPFSVEDIKNRLKRVVDEIVQRKQRSTDMLSKLFD